MGTVAMDFARSLRRIGAIGDIHGEARYLETALKFLSAANLDLILSVGDITDGPDNVSRCCQLLQQYQVATVRGNHERWFLAGKMRDLPDATFDADLDQQSRAFLSALPLTQTFETVAGRLLLCHGLGEYDMGGVWPGDFGYALESNLALSRLILEGQYRFVINGHTHQRMVRSFNHLTIINAGTLYREHRPCFLLADFEAQFVQFFDLPNNSKSIKGDLFQLPGS
jgi:putative phosphoesterase